MTHRLGSLGPRGSKPGVISALGKGTEFAGCPLRSAAGVLGTVPAHCSVLWQPWAG